MLNVTNVAKFYHTESGHKLWALRDVSFSLAPERKLGLVGSNGAGKSTLIRLLGGIEKPAAGKIDLNGMTMSWPLGFSGGCQGGLSGIDNVRFLAKVYGVDFKQLLAFVYDFSELGEHMREPARTYSTGMQARLNFALSVAFDFDCYLIDEVILAGDARFHAKCQEYLFNRNSKKAMVIASHSLQFLAEICDSILVLDNGVSFHFENPHDGIEFHAQLQGV
ncbi:ABC transporter ATP-binding protein [Zavarzinia compransoris]|uniref:ATP-binding protein n=1 Tax=Zavarzinia compransoris TaxID=1264899 RepID=A0A317DXV3_9PROT|nr:ABC transporter ATP-binding protein [Zavarzinia compransoris]PWR19558.1 ATP-binding protein [Zavarzinia compransoris]TDP40899.1 capsular polysaccharide transport system ATP-binding protein [Zavarzinia compransoris]